MTKAELDHILAALIRMEHKTKGAMLPNEYWAATALAREAEAPQFITEYFARKANETN